MNFKKIAILLVIWGIIFSAVIYGMMDLSMDLLILDLIKTSCLVIIVFYAILYLKPNKTVFLISLLAILILASLFEDLNTIFSYFSLILYGLTLGFYILIAEWDKSVLTTKATKSFKENNFSEALEYSNSLLEICPENYFALSTKSSSLRMQGEYEDSLEICNFFLEKHSKDSYFLNLKVGALINLKKIDEAEEVNNKILSKNSKDMIAISNKAQILFEKGFYQDSIDNFEKSVKMMDNKEKWIFVGLKPQKMIPVTSEIVRMWIMKGLAHKNLQQYPEALESFNKALEFDPDSLEAQKNKDEVSGLLQGI